MTTNAIIITALATLVLFAGGIACFVYERRAALASQKAWSVFFGIMLFGASLVAAFVVLLAIGVFPLP